MGNTLSENSFKSSSSRGSSKMKSITKLSFGSKKRAKITSPRNSSISTTTSYASSGSSRYIDGRRFNNSKYALPNDNDEIDRLHMQHYLQRYIWQGNFRSPVHKLLNRPGARV